MSTALYPNPLSAEQHYALGEIIEKGSILEIDGQPHLFAKISPMLVDFLKGIKLENRKNNLSGISSSSPLAQSFNNIATTEGDLGVTLLELTDRFQELKGDDWKKSTRSSYKRVFKIMMDVFGQYKRVKDITPDNIFDLRKLIIDLPTNYPRDTTKMSVKAAVEMANNLGMPKRAHRTIETDLGRIMYLFNWAFNQWYIDRNPVRNIKLSHNKLKAQYRRRSFSDEQLAKIFNAPIYTGCLNDERGYKKPGPNTPRRHRFWLPLIALFSGMRLLEIFQLEVNDIQKIQGIDCIVITDISDEPHANKQLKSESAERVIPIHPTLIRIGFLKYHKQIQRTGEKRLFPKTKIRTSGSSTDFFSVWFNERFLPSLEAKTVRTSFYSFRHNFRDALREANIPRDVIRELCGWSRYKAGWEGIYGIGYRTETLAKYMTQIEYPKLDLTHLYRN